MSDVHDLTFHCMGGEMRLLVEGPHAAEDAAAARAHLDDLDAKLSRFRADSELNALNADVRSEVPAGPRLRAWLQAALWAAQRTDGLVDPTLTGALESAGYRVSRAGDTPAGLADALAAAPARSAARADSRRLWESVHVDDAAGTITRPPGLRLDSGGCGKGFGADSAARLLARSTRFAADCCGDIAIGGTSSTPYEVQVEHPLTHEVTHTVRVAQGGIATSGIDRRIWRTEDGGFAHHLLDPSTGRPAWTGLIAVTVVGASVLEAETLAKAALLSGPLGARRLLRGRTAVLITDDGDAHVLDPESRRLHVSASQLLGGAR